MSGRLILIRHGRPIGHEGRCVGHHDTELDQSACDELLCLASSVAQPPRLVVTSDLERAVESARIIAGAWNAELRFDPRLREMSFGDWEGRMWEEVGATDRAALDAWGADWIRGAPPNGESGRVLETRVRLALADLLPLAEQASTGLAVVSHAGWIRVATTVLLDAPLGSAFDRTIDYARAAVFRVCESRAVLERWSSALRDEDDVSDAALPPAPP